MSEHVMIDLETLGKGSHAAIWTIGSDKPDNFRGETPHQNRSFPRNSKGAMVKNMEKTK